MTLLVWQASGKHVKQIDEICPTGKDANTLYAVKRFIDKYRGHEAEIFVYGDPAGNHEDTRSEKGHNDYSIILSELRKAGFRVSSRVENKAPSVSMRGLFINEIFSKNYEGITIEIDKLCKNTVADYLYLKKAADGTKEKKKVQDPKTKVSYEKHGHCSDANDYFLCKYFYNEYLKFSKRSSGQVVVPQKPQRSRAI
jgi:hypothetical protein